MSHLPKRNLNTIDHLDDLDDDLDGDDDILDIDKHSDHNGYHTLDTQLCSWQTLPSVITIRSLNGRHDRSSHTRVDPQS